MSQHRDMYPSVSWTSFSSTSFPKILQDLRKDYKADALERLEPGDCLNRYATAIQSDQRHLLLVASDNDFPPVSENIYMNGSHVYWASPFYASSAEDSSTASNAYDWICASRGSLEPCSVEVESIKSDPGNWTVGRTCPPPSYYFRDVCSSTPFPVQYCLAQKAEPHCRLQFDSTIAIVVTVLNLGMSQKKFTMFYCSQQVDYETADNVFRVQPSPSDHHLSEYAMLRAVKLLNREFELTNPLAKAVLMFYIAFYINDEPLITMGDAVASFLAENDPTTKNMCLLSIHEVRKNGYRAGARAWQDERLRWKDVTSKKRRVTTILL